ncbi:MAG: amidohydrolase [Gammaproteobacteria bacterium]|nr:amidohydrolase [Gammaproteobacteria bacterium]
MTDVLDVEVNEPNAWRLDAPADLDWERSARAGAEKKYFMVSTDCHANEPADLWATRIEPKYRDRLPRIRVDDDGTRWRVSEGHRPDRLRDFEFEGEDALRAGAGADPQGRIRDHQHDGIDAEVIFPNKGLSMWGTPDSEFAMAQCRVWNTWAWEQFGEYNHMLSPVAAIATGDLDGSMAEIKRTAKLGFRALTLPCKPIWGGHDIDHVNYNLPHFDPMWALIEETGMPITFHVSTGRDPRASRGNGGAVINYVTHSLAPTIEPVANLCGSGVLERFPKLRFATIEAGIGWIPWLLEAMDEAYRKHHMWVRPKLQGLPSDYFKAHGFATFQEDPVGLELAESHGLVDCFMWANDYPHHEGTWPHSAQAVERTMGMLSESGRAKVLGLNAARLFGFEVPASQQV